MLAPRPRNPVGGRAWFAARGKGARQYFEQQISQHIAGAECKRDAHAVFEALFPFQPVRRQHRDAVEVTGDGKHAPYAQ